MKTGLLLCSTFFALNAHTQLLTENVAPENIVQWGEFLGSNYQVANIQFTGAYESSGSYDASQTNIGLNRGLILTTGSCTDTMSGPFGPNDQANSGLDNGFPGYSLLNQIVGANSYNAAVLEFDFTPLIDSIEIEYVFGSEEYPEFAPPNNSTFNDVFGIFLSGPGISGLQNIAVLPNGQTVGINSINPVTNSTYYVNNGDGFTFPFNQSDQYIQYDGYTSVLKAKANLIIGETYHLIIAIADVNDGIYDSGIFLESCDSCVFNVGLMENENLSSVYPNPANDKVYLFDSAELAFVQVYGLDGSLILKTTCTGTLNVENLESGQYIIQYDLNGSINRSRIVIIH